MADPAVVDALRDFKRGILAREASQMQTMAKQWLNVEGALNDRIIKLTEDVAARKERGEVVSEGQVYKLARYQSLVAQTQREFGKYADWSDKDLSTYQRNGGHLGVDHASQAIQLSGVRTAFDRLPYEAVENMVGYARNGMPLNKLLRLRMVKDAKGQPLPGVLDRLTSSLITGTALGRNPRDVAKDMRDDLSGGLAKALLIARTEGLRPYKEMARSQYEKSGVVSGQRRLSAHDGRVCGACLADEGTLYTIHETIPDHPNGRCTSVPVVKGMPEVEWLKGEDWFRTQSEGIQRSILGPARLEMWSQKLFNFSSLVQKSTSTVWGSSITPTPAYMLAPPKVSSAIISAPIPPDLIPSGWVERSEAAHRLGVSTATVSQLTSKGELESMAIKVGNRTRKLISIASIDAYLAKKGEKPPKPSPGAYITVPEAAARYPLSQPEINRLIRDGKIVWKYETLSPGRMATVVDPSSIDAYLATIGKVKPPKPPPPPKPPMDWVKVSRAATLLGFNTTKVRALIKKGALDSQMMRPESEKRSVLHVSVASINAYLAGDGEGLPTKIPAGHGTLRTIAEHVAGRGVTSAVLDEVSEVLTTAGLKTVEVAIPGKPKHLFVYSIAAATTVWEAYKKGGGGGPPKGYYTIGDLAARLKLPSARINELIAKYDIVPQRYTKPGSTMKYVSYSLSQVEQALKKDVGVTPVVSGEWMTVADGAVLAGISSTRLRTLVRQGTIEGGPRKDPKSGRKLVMVSRSSLEAYIASKGKTPPKPVTPSKPSPKPVAGVPKGYISVDQLLAMSGLGFEATYQIIVQYNVPDTTYKGTVFYLATAARAAFAKAKKVLPKGWVTYVEAEQALNLPRGTASKLAARYGLATKWDKSRRTSLIQISVLAAAAQKANIRQLRSMDEKQAEAAEVRERLLEEYPTKPKAAGKKALIRDYLEVPEKERTEWIPDWKRKKEKMPARFKKGIEQVTRLVSRRGVLGRRQGYGVSTTISGRSYHSARTKTIVLGDYSQVDTVVHEMGHALEHMDPEIHKEALSFLHRRTKNERLEWLGDRYDRDETTRKDKFLNPYMGKSYGRDATEIISMGLEFFVSDPWRMAKRDPDMFDFIYSVVRE